MNPPGLVFSIESESVNAALTPALPRRGAGFLRQGFAAFGAGRQGRRRDNTSPGRKSSCGFRRAGRTPKHCRSYRPTAFRLR
mgnify:CR=1 FL=1